MMRELEILDADFLTCILEHNMEPSTVQSPENYQNVEAELTNINFDQISTLQVIQNEQSNDYWIGNFSEEETKSKMPKENCQDKFQIQPKMEVVENNMSMPPHHIITNQEEENHVEVLHPMTKIPYLVEKNLLGKFLISNGRTVETFCKNSPRIQELVESFCDHTRVERMKPEHARMIRNSGYAIEILSTKKGKMGRYKCCFCPLLGQMSKSFPNKENLIRHNALHLRYNKFGCGYCPHKHFRNDTIKQHITLKHPEKRDEMKIIKLT